MNKNFGGWNKGMGWSFRKGIGRFCRSCLGSIRNKPLAICITPRHREVFAKYQEYQLARFRKNRLACYEASKRSYRKHRVAILKRHHIYYSQHKRAYRNARLLREYNFTQDEYERYYEEQHGKCALSTCENKGKLVVDHDHKTGKVRGLLCITCNSQLGWLETHDKAIAVYLGKS